MAPNGTGHLPALAAPSSTAPMRALGSSATSAEQAPGLLAPNLDKSWRLGIQDVQQEFHTPVQADTYGRIPAELDVTLFRNGPGLFSEERHWVDGQGFMLKMAIADGQLAYQSRFIETAAHKVEQQAARRKGRPGIERLYGRYGAPLPNGLWTILRGRFFKNVANTSVLHYNKRLLALGEGGAPERICPDTLQSLGTDRLGAIGLNRTFSAHPKVDAATGIVWNFGVTFEMSLGGLQGRLHFYRCAPDGSTKLHAETILPFAGTMHDFCLTPTKAVFVLAPLVFPKMPMSWMMGQESLGRTTQWQPELGTRVGVMDLKSGKTRWYTTHPTVCQHTVNAWDEGDDVVFDVCDDDAPERWLRWYDVIERDVYPRRLARLRRFRVGPERGVETLYHPLAEMEFPAVDPRFVAKPHSKVFGLLWDEREPFFGTPYKVDVNTGRKQVAKLLPGEYAGEPLLVTKRGQHIEGDVWLMTVVLCTQETRIGDTLLPAGRSELQIFDGNHLERGPVSRSVLPQTVPFGFHGAAVANHLLQQTP